MLQMYHLTFLAALFILLLTPPTALANDDPIVNPGALEKARSLNIHNCLLENYPNARISAEYVIGQPNMTASAASVMEAPQSFAISPATGKIFISAFNGKFRIHRFSKVATMIGGYEPEHSFGNGTACEKTTVLQPRITIDSKDTLWVADSPKNRVFQYPKSSSINSQIPEPNKVFGQDDFTSCLPGVEMNEMNGPTSILIDDEKKIMWVTESVNHRVTRFDKIFTRRKTNSYANISLGIAGDLACTIDRLTYPLGLALDHNGALWVGDRLNQRLLKFNNPHLLETGAPADLVIGKDSAEECGYKIVSHHHLGFPQSITFDEDGTMYIADSGHNRISVFFKAAEIDQYGLPVDFQIGQNDFVSMQQSPPAHAQSLNKPTWVFYDKKFSKSLFVLSTSENRLLKYCSNAASTQKTTNEPQCQSSVQSDTCTAPSEISPQQAITIE